MKSLILSALVMSMAVMSYGQKISNLTPANETATSTNPNWEPDWTIERLDVEIVRTDQAILNLKSRISGPEPLKAADTVSFNNRIKELENRKIAYKKMRDALFFKQESKKKSAKKKAVPTKTTKVPAKKTVATRTDVESK
jgi:hypothetical protein